MESELPKLEMQLPIIEVLQLHTADGFTWMALGKLLHAKSSLADTQVLRCRRLRLHVGKLYKVLGKV